MENKFNKLLKNHELTKDLSCKPNIEKIKYDSSCDEVEIIVDKVEIKEDKNIIKNFFGNILPTLTNIKIIFKEKKNEVRDDNVDINNILIKYFHNKKINLEKNDIYVITDTINIYCNKNCIEIISEYPKIKEEIKPNPKQSNVGTPIIAVPITKINGRII